MFCHNCGAQNADDALFCKSCGSPLHTGEDGKTARTSTPADWSDTATPTAAYDGLGSNFTTPETLNAGKKKKSKAPLVIICALIIAALGAFIVLNPFGILPKKSTSSESTRTSSTSEVVSEQERSTSNKDSGSETAAKDKEGASAEQSTTNSQSKKEDLSNTLLGKWVGQIQASEDGINCYGADAKPFVIEFTSVNEESGRVMANLNVLLHAHDLHTGTQDSDPNDVYQEKKDATMSLKQGQIDFAYSTKPFGNNVEVKESFTVILPTSDNPKMTVYEKQVVHGVPYNTSERTWYSTFVMTKE